MSKFPCPKSWENQEKVFFFFICNKIMCYPVNIYVLKFISCCITICCTACVWKNRTHNKEILKEDQYQNFTHIYKRPYNLLISTLLSLTPLVLTHYTDWPSLLKLVCVSKKENWTLLLSTRHRANSFHSTHTSMFAPNKQYNIFIGFFFSFLVYYMAHKPFCKKNLS